jgi:hypothetical protein
VEELLAVALRHRPVPGEHLDVRPQAGERSPQLVRGIGDELTLRPCRFLERRQHRVEAVGQAADLVPPVALDAAAEIARLRHVLGRRRQAAHRRERRAGDEQPERRGDRHAPARDQEQDPPDPRQRVVDLAQRPRDLERPPFSDRRRDDADVGMRHRRVREERASRAGRHRSYARGDREGDVLLLGSGHVAAAADELHVPWSGAERGPRDVGEEPAALSRLDQADERKPDDGLRARAQTIVDLASELAADDDVDNCGRRRDGDRDGDRGRDGEARPERRRAHSRDERTHWARRRALQASSIDGDGEAAAKRHRAIFAPNEVSEDRPPFRRPRRPPREAPRRPSAATRLTAPT